MIAASLCLLFPELSSDSKQRALVPRFALRLLVALGGNCPIFTCASKYLYLRGVIATSCGWTGAGRADPGEERRGREID